MDTLEEKHNDASPLCIICTLMPQNDMPSYTHVTLYILWRVDPSGVSDTTMHVTLNTINSVPRLITMEAIPILCKPYCTHGLQRRVWIPLVQGWCVCQCAHVWENASHRNNGSQDHWGISTYLVHVILSGSQHLVGRFGPSRERRKCDVYNVWMLARCRHIDPLCLGKSLLGLPPHCRTLCSLRSQCSELSL